MQGRVVGVAFVVGMDVVGVAVARVRAVGRWRTNGVVSEGSITQADFIGPLAGMSGEVRGDIE